MIPEHFVAKLNAGEYRVWTLHGGPLDGAEIHVPTEHADPDTIAFARDGADLRYERVRPVVAVISLSLEPVPVAYRFHERRT